MSVSLLYSNVEKTFPGVHPVTALKNVSFKIETGELFCLLGPSGCGKTTLLRCTAGLESITDGKIFYGDVDVTNIPPRKRNIGMVFQSFALYPHMTVFENVAYGLRVRKVPQDEVRKKVTAIMDLVGLPDVLERNPSPTALSGGQQQRVAVARALVYDPEILLLDEPFANLDAKLRRYMRAEIRRIQKITKVTTIFVTHDQEEAMAIGDRLAVMKDGNTVQIGSADEVYRLPTTKFVANFIGKMNFFPCTIQAIRKDAYLFTLRNGARFTGMPTITNEKAKALGEGSAATLGFRPEYLLVSARNDEGLMSGTVQVIQHLGNIVRYEIQLPDGKLVESDMRRMVSGVTEGSPVSISLDPEGAILFAEDGGDDI